MSDDWFDKTYRSDESTPGDLDDRVLNAARRATRRRWSPPVVAGAAVAAALAVVLVIPTFDEVEPSYAKSAKDMAPPAAQPVSPREPEVEVEPDTATAVELREASDLTEMLSRVQSRPPPEPPLEPLPVAEPAPVAVDAFAPRAPVIEAPVITPPNLRNAEPVPAPAGTRTRRSAEIEEVIPTGAFQTRQIAASAKFIAPMTTCIPDVLTGPIGGPGRRDQAHMCPNVDGGLNIDFVWDGPAPCPTRLVVQDAANVLVILDGAALVVGEVRYLCIDGEWAAREGQLP